LGGGFFWVWRISVLSSDAIGDGIWSQGKVFAIYKQLQVALLESVVSNLVNIDSALYHDVWGLEEVSSALRFERHDGSSKVKS